jgi:Na+-driven multidrug efflux pump
VQPSILSGLLRAGALSSMNSILTNIVIAGTTALVASFAGVIAVAGFGTAVRLEYLLIPLVFGIGAPLVSMVGTNLACVIHRSAREGWREWRKPLSCCRKLGA